METKTKTRRVKGKKKESASDALYRTYFSSVSVDIMDLSKVSAEINELVGKCLGEGGVTMLDSGMKELVAKYRKN